MILSRRHSFIQIVLLLTLVACGSHKAITETVKTEPKPQWMETRPINPSYYIGIGAASKTSEPLDYAQVAKKNALNDLASEISVEIKGESFLNTLEVNRSFHEEFVSNISTTTREQIEGFEVAGSWENNSEYWIYYRLSRAQHALLKKEKKDKALRSSNDNFLKAKDAMMQGNLAQSIDLHLRALLGLKDYWNESNEFYDGATTVHLDNEIYNSLQSILANTQIEPNRSDIVLAHNNNYTQSVKVLVHHKGNPLANIPIAYSYDRGSYVKPKMVKSDAQGTVNVLVADVNIENKENYLSLELDIKSMVAADLDQKLLKPILDNLKAHDKRLAISVILPSAFISSDERNFNESMETAQLSSTLQNALSKKGIRFTSSRDEADFIIDINANTTKGGTSQGFYVAYLQMTLVVSDGKSSKEIYKQTINNIKGLQLNSPSAGLEAYKKGSKQIEKEIVDELLLTIM
jgi:hypothetical protein